MIKIRIGGVPEHFNLPWHLAIEDGMFAHHGIDLEWIMFPEGTGAMNKALRNKEIDLAVILTGGIIKDIANGNPSKILQVYVSSPLQWGVHVAANSDFKSIEELENATCAISRYGSGSHVMAHVQAEQRGWDTSKLKFNVINTLEGAIEALTEGTADYFMWEHFTTKPVVDKGIFRRLGDFPTPWSCFVIAGREDFIEAHKASIEIVLDVINTVTADFKKIPSIDRTLANRYEQQLEDIQQWLSMTTWSQNQITNEELSRVQSKIFDLKMIENQIDINKFKINL
ncbi:substrate-binding domain-containing protein [Dokdonia donghaensis]|uniref:ABC transporter substrate-binding protein n=1 Tax=Dokdonia donghaensis DSW-1 TaxID=1300343 RepID=A0A0A2GRL0_9FLAO|nr:substrate-binding domain-containing protein [Dokdonia donghaensis]ANH60833.1 NMT1/THI5 like protein [Dokdonia donghaensis DSW-1]KGO05909.1 ABC transporter substrate-binding protein [Dokdonia donghaensis DSW-1]